MNRSDLADQISALIGLHPDLRTITIRLNVASARKLARDLHAADQYFGRDSYTAAVTGTTNAAKGE